MSIYDFKVKNMKNEDISLDKYKGKVLLIVNTAPKCGFAPQYEGLEKLYETYGGEKFELLDFPSNQFMNQAPGTNEEIKQIEVDERIELQDEDIIKLIQKGIKQRELQGQSTTGGNITLCGQHSRIRSSSPVRFRRSVRTGSAF